MLPRSLCSPNVRVRPVERLPAQSSLCTLTGTCTEAGAGSSSAVPAKDLMRALAAGKGIDLAGVVIQGDLVFDELPAEG